MNKNKNKKNYNMIKTLIKTWLIQISIQNNIKMLKQFMGIRIEDMTNREMKMFNIIHIFNLSNLQILFRPSFLSSYLPH